MSEPNNQPDFMTELGRELKQVWQATKDGFNHSGVWLRNGVRRLRGAQVDYVVLRVGGLMPERAEPPRSFVERQLPLPPPPYSIEHLNYELRHVADADNVKGVVLVLHGFSTGLASLQNIRQSILRLRERGKTAVVYTPYLDAAHYFIASAADQIIIPPSTQFNVLGLRSEVIFLKDALAQVGLHFDAVQISPYKSSPNMFTRADITPEQQEQLTWLLDEMYEMLTDAMADGRQMTPAEFQQLVNRAPLFAPDALEAGLVDAIAYEDELAYLLAEPAENEPVNEAAPKEEEGEEATPTSAALSAGVSPPPQRPKAKLLELSKAYNLLLEKPRRHTPQFIGVVTLSGVITMGTSQRPPIDIPVPFVAEETAGEVTLGALLRRAEKMDNMAALIFHVDSPGGDALASDLIGREIQRIAQKKPVVVYMGNTAASGGYYVSAPANHIMSQPLTITGSIGVFMMRLSTSNLYQKLHVNRTSIQRGERASLYTSPEPMTDTERQIFWETIVEDYRLFKEMVADGRDLPLDELDPICEGRVWSGRQALAHKLVDSHGDFVTAVQKAAELSNLPTGDSIEVRVVNLYPKSNQHRVPKPYEAAEEIGRVLSGEWARRWSGRPLYLMPFEIRLE
ncbi:MAG TPA: signal peptide peptidase SppA [Chloroflexota bacterium]|nr:signal peptide peptidase SppA [Chloroflexota bacterium]HUM70148.1 signal peptide peptidase SppA [Chloroflexota bacterium]